MESRQIRDGQGQLIGYIEEQSDGSYSVISKEGSTIGWAKKDDASGPGYSVLSDGGERVAHSFAPEYLLAKHYEKTNSIKPEDNPPAGTKPFKDLPDGSDPNYR